MLDFENCTQTKNDRCIVCKERRSKFVIYNKVNTTVFLVRVDGCLVKSSQIKKCDWIAYYSFKNDIAMFIELKGKKLDIAVEQLISTLDITKDKFNQYKKRCYAVTSRVPRSGPKTQKIKIDFYKKTKTTLEIKNHEISVIIE